MRSDATTGPFSPPPTIIVPVYNAPEETEACILSVIRETRPPYRILVLDDASPDPRVQTTLESLAAKFQILELHRHGRNLGFAGNVNYGMKLAEGDVVLLNSDTVVSRRWLDKLVACAYSRADVATVSPVSNAAGAFSVPENNCINALPGSTSVNEFAEVVARAAAPMPVVVPTGHGFCLYIRRAALNKVGLFDAGAFPQVGEENDFSQRAQGASLVNLMDTSCFIHHVGTASFTSKNSKHIALTKARKLLDQRHPSYSRAVREFLDDADLGAFRSRLKGYLAHSSSRRAPRRYRVLSVIHDGGGGMVHTNHDLMRGLLGSFDTYELRCGPLSWTLVRIVKERVIAEWRFSTAWRSFSALDIARRRALHAIVEVFHIDLVHIRTLIGTGPEVLASLAGVGPPVVFSFHDFATVCPTIQLIDERGCFCKGYCTSTHGDCRVVHRWFGDVSNLKHKNVHIWRKRMRANLPLADAFVTTAQSSKNLILEHFPALSYRRFEVIEHGRDSDSYWDVSTPPASPLKMVAFGALNESKGANLLREIFSLALRSDQNTEFHVIGNITRHLDVSLPNVIYHGSYQRDDLPSLLLKIEASYAMICSIWPETYCHTLTEAWMCGLPVVASDIGVIRERIERHGGGHLLDPRAPEEWVEALPQLKDNATWCKLKEDVSRIALPTISDMAARYELVYKDLLCHDTKCRHGRKH